MGGRRQGGLRPRLRRGRRRRQADDPRSSFASVPDGDVRHGRRHEPEHGPAEHLQRQPGAARTPHGVRAGCGSARAEHPHHVQRHRRRLRQQGAGLPRLRLRDRRFDRRRRSGEVDGRPLGEPRLDRVRSRLPHVQRDVLQGRQDHRAARRHDRRPRRIRLDRSGHEVPGRLLPHRHGVLRPPGRALPGQGRVHEQGSGRRRLPVLLPHHRGGLPRRADGRSARDGDARRSGRAADEQLHPGRPVPLRDGDRLGLRLGRLPQGHEARDGDRGLRRPARRAAGEAAARAR